MIYLADTLNLVLGNHDAIYSSTASEAVRSKTTRDELRWDCTRRAVHAMAGASTCWAKWAY
jgi:hypothetical protein